MPRTARTSLISCLAAAFLLSPTGTGAIENCKVKIDRRDGTLLVSARSVGANPRWGFLPGEESNTFFNEGECIQNGKARKCTLGGLDTTERITPPDLCTLYVADDSSTDCAAYVKGCVPGVRDPAQGPGGVVLKDSTGAIIGALDEYATGGRLSVIVNAPDSLAVRVPVLMDGSGFGSQNGGGEIAAYESVGCSGTPLLLVPTSEVGGESAMLPTGRPLGSTIYYAPLVGAETTVRSVRQWDASCISRTDTAVYGEAQMLDLSGFVPPFRAEVQ